MLFKTVSGISYTGGHQISRPKAPANIALTRTSNAERAPRLENLSSSLVHSAYAALHITESIYRTHARERMTRVMHADIINVRFGRNVTVGFA